MRKEEDMIGEVMNVIEEVMIMKKEGEVIMNHLIKEKINMAEDQIMIEEDEVKLIFVKSYNFCMQKIIFNFQNIF